MNGPEETGKREAGVQEAGRQEAGMKKPMDAFELALQRAMARVDAPEGLLEFLMRATEVKRESVLPWRQRKHRFAWYLPRQQAWMGGALAALLTIGVFTASQVHERRDRARDRATEQFVESQHITEQAMAQTREQLRRAGIELDQ
jgi:hypothetical protein